MADRVSHAIVGLGSMARFHLGEIPKLSKTTKITAVCQPSHRKYQEAKAIFFSAKQKIPPNRPDFDVFLTEYADQPDAVFIISSNFNMKANDI